MNALKAEELGHVHFMGIGGAGMSGIARIMAMRGIRVSGCDLKESRALVALRALGVQTFIDHSPDHLSDVSTLVYSSAVRPGVIEFDQALRQGMRVLQRAEALAALMADRRVIAVAGTHGKTTTTSMLTVTLQHAALDPSFAIGGTITDSGANAHDGAGELFVVEADESDGSFIHYRPEIAIVTNIEADHMDHYADDVAVTRAFADFAETVNGPLVVCGDDERARTLLINHQGITYGEGDCDLRLSAIKSDSRVSFDASWRGEDLGRFELAIAGRHNALNAGAVIATALHLGIDLDQIREGVRGFTGTRRRFERRGEGSNVVVIDDYAHHPTEIAATIQAARDAYPNRRIIVAFQPHRYTRTAAFLDQFAQVLTTADVALVTEVYAAGEERIPSATGSVLARKAQTLGGSVFYEPSLANLPESVAPHIEGKTVVLTLGAGDITLIANEIADRVCDAG